jgi:hypothetical protein
LFLGDSYTSVNNLPQMLIQLAARGHHAVFADMVTPGGWSLAQHANSQVTLDKIKAGPWDFVILQDQSYLPALEDQRVKEMFPAVRYLGYFIRQAQARPLLYLTWGRQRGLPEQGFADFDSMQAQLTLAYTQIAQEMRIEVAPVGEAWKAALGLDPSVALWQENGSHPTVAGTYLAACVFYAALYQTSPEGLDFTAGLSKGQAQALQTAAARTVLADKARWNIP